MKRPQLPENYILDIVEANNIPRSVYPVCGVAIRGYYLDSMGRPGVNDRRIFDDAFFIVTPDNVYRFESNTDPNGFRAGKGYGRNKGMAQLKTGIHLYGKGWHKNHWAFRQCESFTVLRDKIGGGQYEHKGWHAINFHRAGYNSTSSLGCQTIRRGYFAPCRDLLYREMKEHGNAWGKNDWKQKVQVFPYILINEADRRENNLIVSTRYYTNKLKTA